MTAGRHERSSRASTLPATWGGRPAAPPAARTGVLVDCDHATRRTRAALRACLAALRRVLSSKWRATGWSPQPPSFIFERENAAWPETFRNLGGDLGAAAARGALWLWRIYILGSPPWGPFARPLGKMPLLAPPATAHKFLSGLAVADAVRKQRVR